MSATAVARVEHGTVRGLEKLECPSCHLGCLSLHTEWRGVGLSQAVCPLCANDLAVKHLLNAGVRLW